MKFSCRFVDCRFSSCYLSVRCLVIKYHKSFFTTGQKRCGSCQVIGRICYFMSTRLLALWPQFGLFNMLAGCGRAVSVNCSPLPASLTCHCLFLCPYHQYCKLIGTMGPVILRPRASKITLDTDVVCRAHVVRSYISCICSRYLCFENKFCCISIILVTFKA